MFSCSLTKIALAKKIKCVPITFSSLVIQKWHRTGNETFPKVCDDLDRTMEQTLFKILHSLIGNGSCRPKCTTMNYRGSLETTKDEDTFGPRTIAFTYSFPTNELEVKKEYLVYDFYGFVGFVGGTLGLFIGFSFYDFLIYAFNSLKSLLYSFFGKKF